MNVYFPHIQNQYIAGRILERQHSLKLSFAKRAYYNFVRPLMPIPFRQFLQKRYSDGIRYNRDFIDDTFVNYVCELYRKCGYNFDFWPNDKRAALVITHDVETQKGFQNIPRIIELEKKYGFKGSWNIIPKKYPISDDILSHIRKSGNEIGIHGYNHDGKLYFSKSIFNKRTKWINKALRDFGAVGFRSPQVQRNLKWLQKLDILYDCSCFDYDPFQPMPGGTGSIWPFIAGKFIELPYTLPQDHVLFKVIKVKNADMWIRKAQWLIDKRGMILTLTHPDYLIEGDNIKYYEELLSWLKGKDNLYHDLPKNIASYWKKRFFAKLK